jgi:hypothetical protein
MAVMGRRGFPSAQQPAAGAGGSRTGPPPAGEDELKSESGHVIGVTPFARWHISCSWQNLSSGGAI